MGSDNCHKNHKGLSSCNIGLGRGQACGEGLGAQVKYPQAFLAYSIAINGL